MSASQNISNSAPTKSLTYDEISKYFSVPLSDAASNLGVCVSVLKKLCRDNGLDRWPYRKFLAGKSIEEIKGHAAREKNKELAEMAKAARQSGSQNQNNEIPMLQAVMLPNKLQQGSKDIQTGRPQTMLSLGSTKGMTILAEFKYGFPSEGLSIVANKWWGSSSPDCYEGIDGDETETNEQDKHKSEEKTDENASSVTVDKQKPENGKTESDTDLQGVDLLASVRKRTVKVGRKARKLGVYRGYYANKLTKKERVLLLRIFGSSLPKEWIHDTFQV